MHHYTIIVLLHFQSQIIPSLGKPKTLIKSSENVADLDYEGKIVLGWTIDEVQKSITFELEGETDGYVGLGISLHGTMLGSDLFIAGVFPNGSSYHSDRFVPISESGETNPIPKIDKISNWRLLKAEEVTITSATKRGHMEVTKTYLKFTRFLDTCDEEEDLSIGKGATKFIWALGESDAVDYHGLDERGTKTINLYAGKMPDLTGTQIFGMTLTNASLPEDGTTAWCTFYQAPELEDKHHVVAWTTDLNDANAQKYVSHMTVYSCSVRFEDSAFETFDSFTIDKFNGTNCLEDLQDSSEEGNEDELVEAPPMKFCTEVLFSWSRRNPDFYLPKNVGYAFGGQEGSLYYMLETRFSNPQNLDDVQLNATVNMHYVDELRPMEAGLLWMGRNTNYSLAIPPVVSDYVVSAICSPNCTGRFPRDGVTIFTAMFHAGLSGRQVKVRHFRRGKELPWIDADDHYNSNYEETKQLLKPVTVLPGDQIILECTFDTMWNNGSFTDETCEGYFWYYPKMEFAVCGSSYPLEDILLDFGITKYNKIVPESLYLDSNDSSTPNEPLPDGPVESVPNTGINWTLGLRQILESKTRFGLQDSICYTHTQKIENLVVPKNPKISYPLVSERNRLNPTLRGCTQERKGSMPGGGQKGSEPSEVKRIILFSFISSILSKYL